MALVDDVVTVVFLASSGFFVALAFGLLVRYRQVSQKISASSDLGHDLWQALEQRMKKQDERILDVMARLEVVQSRVVTTTTVHGPAALSSLPHPTPSPAPADERPGGVMEPTPPEQQRGSQLGPRESQSPTSRTPLDETQLAAMKLLGEGPKNTRQLTDVLKKSREHTARTMKGLFERGLVARNDSTKPFVYQLTEEGKHYVTSGA